MKETLIVPRKLIEDVLRFVRWHQITLNEAHLAPLVFELEQTLNPPSSPQAYVMKSYPTQREDGTWVMMNFPVALACAAPPTTKQPETPTK